MKYDEYVSRKNWKMGEPLQHWISHRIVKELIRVTAITPSQTRVLEIGAGTGTLSLEMKEFGFKSYTAFEPNSELANLTRARNPQNLVLEVALPNVPIEFNDSFDLIVCVHVIEHALNGYDARAWIESLREMLTENGLLLIVSPQISDFKGYFWEIDWSHCFPTSVENLRQILGDLNFLVLHNRSFRLGTTRLLGNVLGKFLNVLLPTRLLNFLGNQLVGRPLGTGLTAALIWGVTFVVATRKEI
jgi:SAM-dependent methyltransferase